MANLAHRGNVTGHTVAQLRLKVASDGRGSACALPHSRLLKQGPQSSHVRLGRDSSVYRFLRLLRAARCGPGCSCFSNCGKDLET